NFISKTPKKEPEVTVLLNRSTLKENNGNLFYSKRWNKAGFTLFTGTTIQKATDVNKDGFSDIPDIKQFNFHPRLFIYPNNRKTFTIGYSGTIEDRKGGDMMVLQNGKNGIHQFIEINKSDRHSIDAQYQEKLKKVGTFVIKTVLSAFNLKNIEAGFSLKGRQINTYSEASYNKKISKSDLVVGVNYITENFTKNKADTSQFNSYNNNTVGVFVQDLIHVSEKFVAEAGFRTDHQNQFGWFALPRIALVYKPIAAFSFRLSVGAGYKIPNPFTQQSEQVSLKEMNPTEAGLKAEKSTGINFDANYHAKLDEWEATINQAFYYTNIDDPVLPVMQLNGRYNLVNLPFRTKTIGTDTYIRFVLDELELYAGYNHTIAKYRSDAHNFVLFAPQDKFSSIIAYEIEGKWRMGVDVSWVGNQYILITKKAPDYWFFAAMIQRNIGKHLTIVLNAENLFDRRQGKKEALYYGSITNPKFYPIWGPIEGRVFNLSVKWAN
ncbi:MAG TPA: TonB-dependent receptor, partial [Chitinophagaceae bacterium]|nr:TonB-dependent receptor [Chitinophagaceae bacterium]